jgi:hypothetical protein
VWDGAEGIAGVAEAAGEVAVLVPPASGPGVQGVEVVRVVDVELRRRDADDGSWLRGAVSVSDQPNYGTQVPLAHDKILVLLTIPFVELLEMGCELAV